MSGVRPRVLGRFMEAPCSSKVLGTGKEEGYGSKRETSETTLRRPYSLQVFP